MTREEAIEQLKWYFECDDGIGSDSATKEALLLALKALKQPEIIRCKDCKFRQLSCCVFRSVYLRPDGFCERGKKKDSAQEVEEMRKESRQ